MSRFLVFLVLLLSTPAVMMAQETAPAIAPPTPSPAVSAPASPETTPETVPTAEAPTAPAPEAAGETAPAPTVVAAPELNTVLQGARGYAAAFTRSSPNFEAEESIVSQRLVSGAVKNTMSIQSTLHIARHEKMPVQEEHVQHLVDGVEPGPKKVLPPYTFDGGFALTLGKLIENRCADYRLAPGTRADSNPIVVLMVARTISTDGFPCAANAYEGKFLIEPESFHVLHMEYKMEDIYFNPSVLQKLTGGPVPTGRNNFTLTVDYGPTTLGSRTYWLPVTLSAELADKQKPVTLSYVAHYTKYRRFGSTATIVGVGSDPTQ